MKKVLFASTALVAAGLMTTGAASAAEKIKLQLGGFSQWWVVGAWQDSSYNAATASTANVDVKGQNEIFFSGSTTLDNGLKVGVMVELEAGGHTDMTSDTIDVSYAFVEGGFGKVTLGSSFGTAWTMHVGAPEVGGAAGPEGIITSAVAVGKPAAVTPVGFAGANTGSAGGLFTGIYTDEKNDKLTYTTPSFSGLTLGATYIPSIAVSSQDNRVMPGGGLDGYALSALYANTFNGVGVKLSANTLTYDGGNAYTRTWEWATGGQVSMAGFTVGGSYKQVHDNRKGSQTSDGNSSSNLVATSGAGAVWDAGVSYATGPYAVGVYYIQAKSDGVVNGAAVTDGEDKSTAYLASVKYTMSPGVDVLGTIGYAKWEDGDTTNVDANNNEGWAIGTGLSLAF